ncbi:MAG: gliding motility-associated C-terminal domain-containing protein [Lewinellaceae bacterium]|nr:gliding motility-associated C-terminal domain-containing protein [Lewinellaceae bacterium]
MFDPTVRADCTDSVHLTVRPVQCHGLRNGVIEITEIFGGVQPFFFSLDGQSYSTRPEFDLLWAGEYVLHVRDATGCVQTYTVLVPEPEELMVQINIADTSVAAGEWVQLHASVTPPGSVLTAIDWRPPALFANPFNLNQYIHLLEDTDIAIEVRNADGCIARDQLSVTVEQTKLYFPNIFNPVSNQNNYFTLFAGEGVAHIVSLQVYDRLGNLVFERRNFMPNDPLLGWNGKWRGRLAPSGVYPWVGQVEFLDGKRQRYSGNVTLVVE